MLTFTQTFVMIRIIRGAGHNNSTTTKGAEPNPSEIYIEKKDVGSIKKL